MAKYMPCNLVVGNAIRKPIIADIRPAEGNANKKEKPSLFCRITTLYAPIAIKAECPRLT